MASPASFTYSQPFSSHTASCGGRCQHIFCKVFALTPRICMRNMMSSSSFLSSQKAKAILELYIELLNLSHVKRLCLLIPTKNLKP